MKALRDVTLPYPFPIQVRAVHAACPMLYNSTSLSRGFPCDQDSSPRNIILPDWSVGLLSTISFHSKAVERS